LVRIHDAKHNALQGQGLLRSGGDMTSRVSVAPNVTLDVSELVESFTRAPGPGGQNVNKVSSAVQLRFDVQHSPSLPDHVRQRLMRLAGQRLTTDGVLIIEAHRHRTQARNRDDARERLFELIRQACIVPKVRRATKPSKGARERRLKQKRSRSEVKKTRGRQPQE
jgi:ribosome-associated protein